MPMTRLVHDATLLVGERHAMVDTHRQLWVLLLEDTAQLDEVGTSTQVTCLCEVAIREDMTGAEVYEMGA